MPSLPLQPKHLADLMRASTHIPIRMLIHICIDLAYKVMAYIVQAYLVLADERLTPHGLCAVCARVYTRVRAQACVNVSIHISMRMSAYRSVCTCLYT